MLCRTTRREERGGRTGLTRKEEKGKADKEMNEDIMEKEELLNKEEEHGRTGKDKG